ncbi:MAG: intradiol ring-cleavage dioxygenase [Gemmatimonadales bacterium]
MERDDIQIGSLLSRREALAVLGMSGAAFLGGGTAFGRRRATISRHSPSCVVRPEQTEGPYFVDEGLNRSDIRADGVGGAISEGVPLALTLALSGLNGTSCAPVPGAHVDVWHCDAAGVYSDVHDPDFDTIGRKFLRGYQLTDAAGAARFQTIYPGWYPGRTVHIHFKIRTDPASHRGLEFTSQLYFDDALTDRVHALVPYVSKGQRRGRNRDDRIFGQDGDQLMLAPTASERGYAATFAIGLQLS